MNQKMRKILSFVLVLCMLLTNASLPAFAAEGDAGSTTTNGSYNADGKWTEGGTGSITHDVDGTNVTLSKTATPTGNENEFLITLQVQTSTTTTVHTDGGAVVLVIDTSSSMKSCAECGGRDNHNSGCEHYVSGWGANNSVTTAQSRLTAAKGAANAFLSSYAGTDPAAARMLAIVTFDGGYRTNLSWVNVAGGANSYSTAQSTINGLGYTTGTNMEGGLSLALGLLSDAAVSSFSSKNVVLLSDGAPTQRIGNTSISASKANCDAAANQATAIKNAGAKLYTVCFGAARDSAYSGGPTVSAFLSGSVATSGCAYDADNTAQLNAAFKAITESITSGLSGSGWTATDPMADMISVTSGTSENFTSADDKTYTWKLDKAQTSTSGNVTTYTYTYSYTVKLNVQGQTFEEGKFFPTNERTYLNLGEGKTLEFPVPGVQGKLPRTDVSVTKEWDDAENQDGIRTSSVTVQLKNEEGKSIGEPVVLNADNNWTYTWDGETYNLISQSKGVYHLYTVEELEVPDGYEVSYPNERGDFTLVVKNSHEVEKKDIIVTKVWDDKNNQDGIRPGSIKVNLLADGEVVATAELTADSGWTHTFSGFDVYKAGKAINYTVKEAEVPNGYTASVSGLVITNTHETETTSVTATKIWDDNNNQDGKRPPSVTFELYANGEPTGKTLAISGSSWTGTFTDLDKYANGQEIVYSVREVGVPEGYTASENGMTVTNSHTPEKTVVSGSKTWVDNNNQDGVRPESITINLLKNGEVIDTITVTEADGWAWSFTDLDKYENGELINYAVREAEVEDYSASYNGYNVTNTHTPAQTSVSVSKVWNDNNDQDGIRANDITITLLANSVATGKTVVLNSGNGWTGSFTALDKYAAGAEIVYTVAEVSVEGYTTVISGDQHAGYTVTNTHETETISVSGTKTWVDNDNQDGVRPESITINLLKNGEVIDSKVVTEADGWAWTFENLPKYENHGTLITYSITEERVEDYSTEYNGYDVTNTHTPEQTSVTVTKSWQDNNDQDGIRANDITVELVANDVPTGKTLVLSDGNNWTGSFTGLDKYTGGTEIIYTVNEIKVDGYETVITGDQYTGYTVTNAHTPETVTISGAKTWDDNDNQDGKRPESITINLLKNGTILDTITVTEADGWAWSFAGLPKYENHGTLIVYSITENGVAEYTTSYNGYNVTNVHTPEQTSVTVTKSWQDNNDQDGIRPEDITVELLANNESTGLTLVLNEGNSWTGSFTELDVYENGEVIVYTVNEVKVEGYESVITGDQNSGYTITNSHTTETVEVSGSKTWDDNNNQDGFRPESITIHLLKNGKVIDTKVVTAEDGWAWSFVGLPKYEDHGTLITYSITEDAVEDYSTTINGFNVVNAHTPEQTSVIVSKSWLDNNDQDGIRPNDITVTLLANNEDTGLTLVLSDGNNWTGSFTELDKYENGEVITYTVEELSVGGYSTVITGSQKTGFTITNSHTPETVVVSGAKNWVDADNQDGFRPESITINLLANGEVIKTVTVTEADNWSWRFDNLPKYENHGILINYSVTEEQVEDYSTEYDGYNVTNSHTPEQTSVTVAKSWQDNDDQDGIRPADITVELVANNEPTGKTLILSSGNNWTGSFTELDKYAEGVEIVYTVAEVAVEGYNPVITGDQTSGYTITNSHTPEVVSVSGSKTWDDNDNQDGFRPESITINLLADGEIIDTIEVTEETEWTWTFDNLPKYKNHGTEIVYSITENAVEDYSAEYDGFNVTNTHTPEQTSVTVTKSWQDNDDQDGIRPEEITVILLANGEATGDELVLDAEGNWTGSFTELDVYAEGEKIVYTVEEIEIEGYETVITGDQTTGFQITNSHTPEVIEISGSKTWDDANNQDGARPESITVNLMANGKVVKTATVTEAEEWSYSFENLPKYENGGNEIIYAITEEAVEGYTTTYDGYNITNSYTPAEISLTVTKAWADSDDEDGLRPSKVTILLYANGEKVDEKLVLNAKNNWSGSFVGLPKYANGEEIVYTIGEVSVKGYNTVIRGSMEKGFVVTNSHTVIPQTSDERTPILWMLMLLGSVAVVGYMGYDYKRRRMAK